jgi:hypothetical protein
MPSISPLIARIFDDPQPNRRHRRDREGIRSHAETKGRVARRRSH